MPTLIGPGALIVASWNNLRRNFGLYAEFAAWFVVMALVEWFLINVTSSLITDPGVRTFAVPLVRLPVFLVYLWLIASMTDATAHTVLDKPADIRRSLAFGMHRILPFFWVSFLFGAAIMGGTMLLIVPGFFLLISLQFAFSYVVVDEMGGTASLLASHRLVAGRWWKVASRICIPAIFFILINTFLTDIIQLIAGLFLGNPGLFLANTPINIGLPSTHAVIAMLIPRVISSFTAPLWYATGLILWYDLKRTRGERA